MLHLLQPIALSTTQTGFKKCIGEHGLLVDFDIFHLLVTSEYWVSFHFKTFIFIVVFKPLTLSLFANSALINVS